MNLAHAQICKIQVEAFLEFLQSVCKSVHNSEACVGLPLVFCKKDGLHGVSGLGSRRPKTYKHNTFPRTSCLTFAFSYRTPFAFNRSPCNLSLSIHHLPCFNLIKSTPLISCVQTFPGNRMPSRSRAHLSMHPSRQHSCFKQKVACNTKWMLTQSVLS